MANPNSRSLQHKSRSQPAPLAKGRPRQRPAQSVDTNILSYDRTDPFYAINVLRKLLGSLPSRIGGCQFKLTPEEHKLTLGLLTIVEPFIGLSPSRRTITRQPTEILDGIMFYLDNKRDLLSLALACKRMHGVIFPRHFEYRVIRAKPSSLRVWNHLIVHRSLARNVRKLEIMDERSAEPEVVPSGIMTTDTDVESSDDELGMHVKQERLLVAAIAKMSSLRSFQWSCNHSPVAIDAVWPTLLKCQSISEVEINDNLVFSSRNVPLPKDPQRIPVMRDLKTVAVHSTRHIYGCAKNPQMARINGMLTSCPNLETLNIDYEHRRGQGQQKPTADEFFLCSRWSGLRSLSLVNLRCSTVHGLDAASTFFASHSNLEVLHLDFGGEIGSTNGGPRLTLEPNSLPKLRELHCNREVASIILSCPTDMPRPLEILRGVRLSNSPRDQPFLAGVKSVTSSLKRLELDGYNDIDDIKALVECAPKLTYLDIGKKTSEIAVQQPRRGDSSTKVSPANIASNVMEWGQVLESLSELVTFHGVKFFYEVSSLTLATLSSIHPASLAPSEQSRVRKNDQAASFLAYKCPKLRRLDHWDEATGKVIVLLREASDVKWDIRRSVKA
ncbi:hypothetical protein CONPUDRAFT_73011 [Coniophora puteana RWD-64-598 SS2]|uniref:F-box domain-containing protein n=1 Tax=Coniophora puteana (strain RWD-64-598) TaxID=741705 RepID=A0A5M3MR51_CONPW|nr:uncharacterized protein CONPUDRAFT_73011 [Coniophora puteana RWD-64-598 SS2]EIW81224.1 hypothetical protein CONPUDRAFT_73011 [Coniophora puteana RWD-64-598 SS2]